MKFILLLTLVLSAQAYAQEDNKNQGGSEHQESHGQAGGVHGSGDGKEGGMHGSGHEEVDEGCCEHEHDEAMITEAVTGRKAACMVVAVMVTKVTSMVTVMNMKAKMASMAVVTEAACMAVVMGTSLTRPVSNDFLNHYPNPLLMSKKMPL